MAYDNTRNDLDNYGFDCTFVAEPPCKLICPICVMLLRDPYQSQCCGCHYCHCCVEQLMQKNLPCVMCSGTVKAFRDVSVTQQINSLQVMCSNKDWGCGWTGDLGVLGEHLVKCDQKPAKCGSCGLFVPKDILREHGQLHCPKRAYTCKLCNNFTSTYDEVRRTHWPQCPSYPIPCPNECSSSKKVPRSQLIKHLNEECDIKMKMQSMTDRIKVLESTLELKEQRITELETELQIADKKKGKKSKRKKSSEDASKEGVEDTSDRSRSSTADSGKIDPLGKERNFELEVNVLKECIAEKVAEIEELRMRNTYQCNNVMQMEEDFTSQLRALKQMVQRLTDEKESLERRISQQQKSSNTEDRFAQLI